MRHVRLLLIGGAAVATVAGLSLAAGCSCEESKPPAPPAVRVVAPPPANAGPAAPAVPVAPGGAAAAAAHQPRLPGQSILNAPADYYGTVLRAPGRVRSSVSDSVLTHDIAQYKAMNGENPPSLAALGEWLGEPVPPPPPGCKYVYDSQAGTIEVVKSDQ